MYLKAVSKFVRWYLRKAPITEGKKQLLSIAKGVVVPDDKLQVEKMKHDAVVAEIEGEKV